MRTFRGCAALAIMILLCSGCAPGSVPPAGNSQTPASAINSPLPTETTTAAAVVSASPAPSTTVTNTRTASPTPSATPTDTSASDTAKPADSVSVLFNEDNFTQYFQFGMSRKALEKELAVLGIKEFNDWGDSANDDPINFDIVTIDNDMTLFHFNAKDQLYSIETYGRKTAKGLNVDDSIDQMHLLYGKEDEYEIDSYEYVYHKENYMLSFHTDYRGVYGWSVFVNTWNDPNAFSSTHKLLGGDDKIKFNEDNYSKYFRFGMSRQDVEKILTKSGVRITEEQEYRWNKNSWSISTDHIGFTFDAENRLRALGTADWATAKGLKTGDSVDKLHLLYGKEDKFEDINTYVYKKKGYELDFGFVSNDSDGPLGLESWSVSAS